MTTTHKTETDSIYPWPLWRRLLGLVTERRWLTGELLPSNEEIYVPPGTWLTARGQFVTSLRGAGPEVSRVVTSRRKRRDRG